MTESEFIENNISDWEALERMLKSSNRDADKLQVLFVKVSADLSYASTYYPNRSVRLYLNKLTQQVFDTVEKKSNTKLDYSGVRRFFSIVLPLEIYRSRKALLLSFVVFSIAVVIGAVSTAHSDDFARVILGDRYVNMTVENINAGDPMAVYKDPEKVDMFLGITINNIRVSFFAFILGIFGGVGTFILLMSNGIMVGTFQYFFYKKGLLATSFFTIWIHGTIEISAIIIAGAAGFVLGNGLLFPKTHSRGVSLQVTAKRAVRIIVGIVPLFIIAGFLESFVTRLTDLPLIVKAFVILSSLALIIGVYVVFPKLVYERHKDDDEFDIKPMSASQLADNKNKKLSYGQILNAAFASYRVKGGAYFGFWFKWIFSAFVISFAAWLYYAKKEILDLYEYIFLFHQENVGIPLFAMYLSAFVVSTLFIIMTFKEDEPSLALFLQHLKQHFIKAFFLIGIPLGALYFLPAWSILIVFLILPPQYIIVTLYRSDEEKLPFSYADSFQLWGFMIMHSFILLTLALLMMAFLGSSVGLYLQEFLRWHDVFSVANGSYVFFVSLLYVLIIFTLLPLYVWLTLYTYTSYIAKKHATDMNDRYESFGTESKVFETL